MIYKAAGFVEALIAIAVAGIASVVLMGIAADTTAQVLRNEISDSLTQSAIEGGELVKKIADNHNSSEDPLFPPLAEYRGSCFQIEGSSNSPTFPQVDDQFIPTCSYDASGGRDQCIEPFQDDEYFRVYCLTADTDVENGLAIGKVVVGLPDCEPEDTAGKCQVKDYQYFVVAKVEEE
jgi:hypothetical protein